MAHACQCQRWPKTVVHLPNVGLGERWIAGYRLEQFHATIRVSRVLFDSTSNSKCYRFVKLAHLSHVVPHSRKRL